MKTPLLRVTLVLLATAIAFRLFLYWLALVHLPPSCDEAWPSLMAMRILKGEYPVVYWGQTYMGTPESYFDALLIALFGPHLWVVRLYPLLFGFVYLGASVVLAARVYNREVALITLALLAVPVPYVAMCGAQIAPDNCLAITALGGIALILLHALMRRDTLKGQAVTLAWLGFILGFAFWMHLPVISFIGVVVLFLFLKDKLVLFRKATWAGLLAFIVGALPLLWYNLANHWATFSDVGGAASWKQSWHSLQDLFRITLHFLIGLRVMFIGDTKYNIPLPLPLAVTVGAIWIGVLLLVLVLCIKPLGRLLKGTVRPWDGTLMLFALAGATLFLFCHSSRASWQNVRYVLPIVAALPVLLAYGLWQIRVRSRLLFAVLLAIIMGAQAWGNGLLIRAWRDPQVVAKQLLLPDTRGLVRWLEAHNIRHSYAYLWLSYRLTFETREHIICSEPYNKRFPFRYDDVKYMDEVRGATRVAYIWHPAMSFSKRPFDEYLQRAGGTCRKDTVDGFTVYYDFKPPYGDAVLSAIPRDQWLVSARDNGSTARLAMDGNRATRWNTVVPQGTGSWFQVDLGATYPLAKIGVLLGSWNMDFPRAYQVDVSTDGHLWQTVRPAGDGGGILYWEGTHPRFLIYGDYFTVTFAPVQARYLRLVLTAAHPRFCWSISELTAFAAFPAP